MISMSAFLIGAEALTKKLAKLDDAVQTVDILDEAEAIILNRIRTRFLDEQDTEGNPWVPSRAGLARRSSGGAGTLFDTGTLFHSIQAYTVGPTSRAIGTDVEYADDHQYGLGVVKREFLGVSDEDATIVERRLIQRIEEALK